jgi:tetratricopeptide (TPR) repeat protein
MLDNQKKHGDNFVVNSGLMRAYSAKGDFAKAIEFADKAIAQAPNDQQKKATEDLKTQLKGNKDIN